MKKRLKKLLTHFATIGRLMKTLLKVALFSPPGRSLKRSSGALRRILERRDDIDKTNNILLRERERKGM